MDKQVWTFFYGSYINFAVLKEVDLVPVAWETAVLKGFDIRIEPRANLVPSDDCSVYGIVAKCSHQELTRLYAHARDVLGEVYLPEAVVVETSKGQQLPALCYICPNMQRSPADTAYVRRIAEPGKEFGFPDWYIARLESFLPD